MTESDDNELRLAQARPRQQAPQPAHDLPGRWLNAVSLYAIGVASEGGRNPYSLAFAGEERNGLLYPAENSGITIGNMQTDLGQRPHVAAALVNAFQEWTQDHRHPQLMLTARQRTEAIASLSRNGPAIEDDGRRPLDPEIKQRLNRYLASEQGMNFVHAWDATQVSELAIKTYQPLERTRLYDNASFDDQIRMAAVMGKLRNQNPEFSLEILGRAQSGEFRNFAGLDAAITADGGPHILSGRDAALEGAKVMIALRNSDPANPLRNAWGNVVLDPLIRPTALDEDRTKPHLAKQHAVIRELFIQRQQAPDFIEALDKGGVSRYGRQTPDGTRFAGNGLYASGNNFAIWNNRGEGVASINGVWKEFDRDDLTRVVNGDGTIDLRLRQGGRDVTLLHVDPKAPELRPERPQPPAQGRRADLMTDPDHVANPNWQQAQQAMRLAAIDPNEKLTPDQRERVTAGVVAGVLADTRTNMSGIDRIDASTIADPQTGLPKYLIAGQGDPTTGHYRRVAVDVSEALNTPVEQSSEVARSATQTREQAQAQQLAQAQTLNQDGPSGPTMRIGARGAGGGDTG